MSDNLEEWLSAIHSGLPDTAEGKFVREHRLPSSHSLVNGDPSKEFVKRMIPVVLIFLALFPLSFLLEYAFEHVSFLKNLGDQLVVLSESQPNKFFMGIFILVILAFRILIFSILPRVAPDYFETGHRYEQKLKKLRQKFSYKGVSDRGILTQLSFREGKFQKIYFYAELKVKKEILQMPITFAEAQDAISKIGKEFSVRIVEGKQKEIYAQLNT